jgi:hypothetical protein
MLIRVSNLRCHPGLELPAVTAERLGIPVEEIRNLELVKASVDGRGRRPVKVATVDVEVADPASVLARFPGDPQVREAAPVAPPAMEGPQAQIGENPLVVGTGPAGLFVAWALARKGYRPILIDRGKALRERWTDVNAYWRHGELNPESNVVFGDGGAGTFSDGKLYTRRNDSRNRQILEFFAELADAPDILVEGRPHLGTNRLSRALVRIKEVLRDLGVTQEFECRLEDLIVTDGRVRGARAGGRTIETDAVFLATGHSARDVFELLLARGVALEARPMAVGSRAEHPQPLINISQFGSPEPDAGPADYMLSYNDRRADRAAYTFCMCPGGEVVGASTDPQGLTVNGMSYSHRAGRFGNAAVVVTVSPEDYPGEGPLRGLDFQRSMERAAYTAGGGGHVAPAQRIQDFLAGSPSRGSLDTSYRTGVRAGDVAALLPEAVVRTMQRGLRHFAYRMAGYDGADGVLIGVETRTTSPVRVVRDEASYQSVSVAGLFPIGEGAGYAGGIMSSASDGLRAAERVAARR